MHFTQKHSSQCIYTKIKVLVLCTLQVTYTTLTKVKKYMHKTLRFAYVNIASHKEASAYKRLLKFFGYIVS